MLLYSFYKEVAKIVIEFRHHICIEEAKILAKVDHYHNRKFREAIKIEKQPNNLNKDDGWKISQNWIPTLTTRTHSRN
jgi:hypothetical protein